MVNEHITRREAKERIEELEDALEDLLEIVIYYPEKRQPVMEDIEQARDVLRGGLDFEIEVENDGND
jgi:hypothetical protein